MAKKTSTTQSATVRSTQDEEKRLSELASASPVAGITGPGRWLVLEYLPTALFSLKISLATSSVGKTLVVPTPYAIKMAYVDAGFRAGLAIGECGELLKSLVGMTLRVAPPSIAVVTHTFVKIRQESRDDNPLHPYTPNIAYREVVYHQGLWRWAFDLAVGGDSVAEWLVYLAPYVTYIGKRGSFIQYVCTRRLAELGDAFTQPLNNQPTFRLPIRAHIVPLDDFGPEANLQILSSYTPDSVKRDKHRKFVNTIVPLGVVNTGPGFTEYRAGETS
ncbi:MAG: hypothetical protein AAB037_00385 [Chloroflexota bacterium]